MVGIRVVDPVPEDVVKVARQLGRLHKRLDRPPDISIRFVERIETDVVTCVGIGDTGFDGEEFYLLQGSGATRAKVLFPFDAVGSEIEIVCERHVPAVPHLLTCINMVALAKGVLPLHASAFEQDGRGVLVMGWSKGGTTESLLAAMDRGARYVGDEWVYLTPDGEMMGLPEPVRLWAWHLEQQPRVIRQRRRSDQARLAGWRALASAAAAVPSRGPVTGLARRAEPLLQRQAFLQMLPDELFGHERVKLRGRLDAAVLLLSHDSEDIIVERAAPREISGRMASSLAHERAHFLDHYQQFRFAFPSRRSDVVETATARERVLLEALFDGRTAGKVTHPYPCHLGVLGDHVEMAVERLAAQEPVREAGVGSRSPTTNRGRDCLAGPTRLTAGRT